MADIDQAVDELIHEFWAVLEKEDIKTIRSALGLLYASSYEGVNKMEFLNACAKAWDEMLEMNAETRLQGGKA